MLVLSRKPDEKILIGENVSITILQVRGNKVRIGIEAPRDIRVMRSELPTKETDLKDNSSPTKESVAAKLSVISEPTEPIVASVSFSRANRLQTSGKSGEINRLKQLLEERQHRETILPISRNIEE